ncbi:MAG TPA: hypothetical protein VMF58_17520 [Rhizomicrobium sp.]|nr:hypothetical protein [Rhizomicrobium sp.]
MKAIGTGVVLVGICLTNVACGQQQSLAPDLALNFECKSLPSEAAVEDFLLKRNFEVANLERVRRQFQRSFFPMDIEAIDKRSWAITFRGLDIPAVPTRPEHVYYTVDINSPPPTKHDDTLEEDVKRFVSDSLSCKITSTNRDGNAVGASDFFWRIIEMQKSRMREAEICDKTISTYSAAKCAKVPGLE